LDSDCAADESALREAHGTTEEAGATMIDFRSHGGAQPGEMERL